MREIETNKNHDLYYSLKNFDFSAVDIHGVKYTVKVNAV